MGAVQGRVDRELLQGPRSSRAILWLVFGLGLVLVAGAVSELGDVSSAVGLTLGAVFAVFGLGGALARARCDETGISYRYVRRWHVPTDQVTDVQVQARGYYGLFPTLVIYRRSGRPLVLRGVADYMTKAGWARTEDAAARWRQSARL